MPILRGGFAVFISHFGLDADDKSLLRLVCKEFKEQVLIGILGAEIIANVLTSKPIFCLCIQVDLSMRHIQPQQISSANDLSRFKNVRHLDISKAPVRITYSDDCKRDEDCLGARLRVKCEFYAMADLYY